MPGFDYGHITEMTIVEPRKIYATSVNSVFPAGALGTTMDGRWFKFSRAGASTLVPGNVLTGPTPVTNHVNNTATATAAGATTVTFTQGATAVTQNQYKDGWMTISVTPGAGYSYAISDHAAVGSATSFAWPLAPGEAIAVALTTTSRIDLIPNPYRGVIQAPTTTIAATPVGIAIAAALTGQWSWVQCQGAAGVLTDSTVIVGNIVATPSTVTAGACVALSQTIGTTVIQVPIGKVLRAAATTAWSTVDLNML